MFPDKDDIRYLDVEDDSDEELGLKFEDNDWEQYIAYVQSNATDTKRNKL